MLTSWYFCREDTIDLLVNGYRARCSGGSDHRYVCKDITGIVFAYVKSADYMEECRALWIHSMHLYSWFHCPWYRHVALYMNKRNDIHRLKYRRCDMNNMMAYLAIFKEERFSKEYHYIAVLAGYPLMDPNTESWCHALFSGSWRSH